jgi:alpha-galactosidase
MPTAIKLTIIGAGSATFSVGVIRDVCMQRGLAGSRVTLMDIDEDRLSRMHEFGRRYAAELGVDVAFDATTDREVALSDADFVLNSALVGGHALAEDTRKWTETLGYYRGFGLSGFGNIRLMLAVARDMERLCPNAWLIMAGNPVFEGCTVVTRETSIKTVGVCHGHLGYRELAELLGLNPDKVRPQAVGFNHFLWLTHLEYEGRNVLPMIDEWMEHRSQQYWRDYKPHFQQSQTSAAAFELYKIAGLFPIGDTVRGAGCWWFHTDLEAKKRWYGQQYGGHDSEIGWGLYLERLEKRVSRIHEAIADKSAKLTKAFPPTSHRESHFPLIDAIVNDNRCELQLNVPNRGAIEGLPDDIVVEVPALCSMRGVQPIHVGKLPEKIMVNWMWPRYVKAERTIKFAMSPDAHTLMTMILDDHRTRSYQQAVELFHGFLDRPEYEDLRAEIERNGTIPDFAAAP